MNLREHLQFLILMIPTLLLLVAAALTLGFPSNGASAPAVAVTIVHESEIGPQTGADES